MKKYIICLIVATACVTAGMLYQRVCGGSRVRNEPRIITAKLAKTDQTGKVKTQSLLISDSREKGLPERRREGRGPTDMVSLKQQIMTKRQAEIRNLGNTGMPVAPDSNVIRVVSGAYDPNLSVRIEGKIKTQEEALPQILEWLWQDDKTKLIEAIVALRFFRASIADTEVIDRLVQIYRDTVSPRETVGFLLDKDELDSLELKLVILHAMT
jgi:hypothetical protein